MGKIVKDFEVTFNQPLTPTVNIIHLRPVDNRILPELYPGQFVNVQTNCKDVFLRRPFSICNFDLERNELWLIIRKAGKGSVDICNSKTGQIYNCILPLGNTFRLPSSLYDRFLLIGGGVGVAPLYFLGTWLSKLGIKPNFLVGARNKEELFFIERLKELGNVEISTDDGSAGSKGVVSDNKILDKEWSMFYVCGPVPMMKKIAKIASEKNINCQVSLENTMACGLGACLCCVEDTKEGNVCVCTKGPVFNINDLKW